MHLLVSTRDNWRGPIITGSSRPLSISVACQPVEPVERMPLPVMQGCDGRRSRAAGASMVRGRIVCSLCAVWFLVKRPLQKRLVGPKLLSCYRTQLGRPEGVFLRVAFCAIGRRQT